MKFRVRLLSSAQADAAELFERVSEAAPVRGPIWYKRLIAAMVSLQLSPRRCVLSPENDLVAIEVRQLLFGSKPNVYRVLFTV